MLLTGTFHIGEAPHFIWEFPSGRQRETPRHIFLENILLVRKISTEGLAKAINHYRKRARQLRFKIDPDFLKTLFQ
jgi:hypothetical protein